MDLRVYLVLRDSELVKVCADKIRAVKYCSWLNYDASVTGDYASVKCCSSERDDEFEGLSVEELAELCEV